MEKDINLSRESRTAAQPVSSAAPFTSKLNTNTDKTMLWVISGIVITFTLAAAGFGTFIYVNDQRNKEKSAELAKQISELESKVSEKKDKDADRKPLPTLTATPTAILTPSANPTNRPTATPTPAPIIDKIYNDTDIGIRFTYPGNFSVTASNFNSDEVNQLKIIRVSKSSTSYLEIEYNTAGFGCMAPEPGQEPSPDKVDALISGKSGYIARLKTLQNIVYSDYSSNQKDKGFAGICGVPLWGLRENQAGYLFIKLFSNSPESDYGQFDEIMKGMERV